MLKTGSGMKLQHNKQLRCVQCAIPLGPKRPIRLLGTTSLHASATVAFNLDGSNEIHGRTAHARELPAARIATLGQQLVTNCAALTLVTAVFQLVIKCVSKARDAIGAALPAPSSSGSGQQDWQQQVKEVRKHTRLLAFVLPLAKAFAAESLTSVYARTFERAAFGFAKMYLFCLFMRVLLSWFPSIDWNAQPWAFLRLITEPYLQIYRGILPPLFGQLDFTPLFGFLILQDVVELMSPVYTLGHARDTSMYWTTSDIMCYFDGH
ncbi:hypothetical protein Vretimale_11169 [Volvox reticuliferus]|uniref:Uncharacterized protein n=1 Tax=Volvox reticuliferus TaxID=1737510 RepID=A0A8J4FQU3_9CHLO|nr:hypothetical protein Vretifemale_12045 [Volvox reticuliferus]GIM06933.1 hypothetical protein Vretimale_11169 [Volvox reticuliferus]